MSRKQSRKQPRRQRSSVIDSVFRLSRVYVSSRTGPVRPLLEYTPFEEHRLPELVEVTDENGKNVHGFIRKERSREVIREGQLYRLSWAGEMDHFGTFDVSVPLEIVEQWPSYEKCSVSSKNKIRGAHPDALRGAGLSPTRRVPLSLLVKENVLPLHGRAAAREIPVWYHLAVNRKQYSKDGCAPHPVAALPAKRIDQVLGAVFMPDHKGYAAIQYLKHLAESHWSHPMFDSFDTAIRDELGKLSIKATQLYFQLISDYTYDPKTEYHDRSPDRHWWSELAGYFFWAGRTGGGLYAHNAGFPTPATAHAYVEELFKKELADVHEQLEKWNEVAFAPRL